jgi:hypothetical protein
LLPTLSADTREPPGAGTVTTLCDGWPIDVRLQLWPIDGSDRFRIDRRIRIDDHRRIHVLIRSET